MVPLMAKPLSRLARSALSRTPPLQTACEWRDWLTAMTLLASMSSKARLPLAPRLWLAALSASPKGRSSMATVILGPSLRPLMVIGSWRSALAPELSVTRIV